MTTIEERSAYLNNPFLTQPIYGNFSPFYVTIAVCAAILTIIFALNIVLGCCSKHKGYWQDRHTGNRWLVSIWSATPHQQPPLDLTELKDVSVFQQLRPVSEHLEYVVTHEKEPRGYGRTQYHHQPQQHSQEEYVELHKRESDI